MRRSVRVSVRVVVGLVAAAAPYLLLFLPHNGAGRAVQESGFFMLVVFGSPFVGPVVFTLFTRVRPVWLHGLAFSALVGIVAGGLWGEWVTDEGRRLASAPSQ